MCITSKHFFDLMQDEIGETALHAASKEGHVEVMTVLIQRGANVNSLSKVCVSILFPQHVRLNFSRVHVYVYGMDGTTSVLLSTCGLCFFFFLEFNRAYAE